MPTIAPRFPLGRILATPGALRALTESHVDSSQLIRRHHHGDWGNLHQFGLDANELALRQGMRLLSA